MALLVVGYEVMISVINLWYVKYLCWRAVWPKGMSHSCVMCQACKYVCVCIHLYTVDSQCACCMWEHRESTWLRGESQGQVIALTFNSNEVLGR